MGFLNKNFTCDLCGRFFKRKCDLSRHIKKCSPIKVPYVCKRCGKLVTIAFASGVFCSRKCSNSKAHSQKTREKIALYAKKNQSGFILKIKLKHEKYKRDYYLNPKRCYRCGEIIDYSRRDSKTCGKKECAYAKCGGLRVGSVKGKSGIYKGFYCDSTYELVFLIYCLDHKIPIERNKRFFNYFYRGTFHKYYPDFFINNRMLIEIKNYPSELTDIKIKSVEKENQRIKVLYGNDLVKICEYVSKTYNKKFTIRGSKISNSFEELYDK